MGLALPAGKFGKASIVKATGGSKNIASSSGRLTVLRCVMFPPVWALQWSNSDTPVHRFAKLALKKYPCNALAVLEHIQNIDTAREASAGTNLSPISCRCLPQSRTQCNSTVKAQPTLAPAGKVICVFFCVTGEHSI